ncbi:MAG: metallophosphoesterase [Agitococcus sp.]|nr:metallophosphoesterase [Agitococcus sp.]
MKIALIHLSDIHFRPNWHENLELVLSKFFADLESNISKINADKIYLAMSGDIVQAGDNTEQYQKFMMKFHQNLENFGIPKEQRICVPGNHDISTKHINDNFEIHQAFVGSQLGETDFNSFLSKKSSSIISDKFSNYIEFQDGFAKYGIAMQSIGGVGWSLSDNIGIFCLNTALLSSGGVKKEGVFDYQRLAIDTRNLQKWCQENSNKKNILIMHHPIDWLNTWSKTELQKILQNNFCLCISGHKHDQQIFHNIAHNSNLFDCSAPPLFTSKNEELGYSIITICEDSGVEKITYRQWTKHHSFVAGVNFSNTDDGTYRLSKTTCTSSDNASEKNRTIELDLIGLKLEENLNDALQSFSEQPTIWVNPLLGSIPDTSSSEERVAHKIDIDDIPESAKIFAPPQFGLTCIGHYLIKNAWVKSKKRYIYIDARGLKPFHKEIIKYCNKVIGKLGLTAEQVDGFVLDSIKSSDSNISLYCDTLSDFFPKANIYILITQNDSIVVKTDSESVFSKLESCYVWSLSRNNIRSIVRSYNKEHSIGDENAVVAKIALDLDNLNLHRTPLNCLTLLKVSEASFDDNPVNRSEMLKRVLFVLFNFDSIPSYKTKPDLKDCEYALGYFCETLVRSNNYSFSRENFISDIEKFCEKQVIDLDIVMLFDILFKNNIITECYDFSFCFRYSYWIHYFVAQRMHQSVVFADFIFVNKDISSFPEILEFYTGVDRRREDAIKFMIQELTGICDLIEKKYGSPKINDIYKLIQWNLSPERIKQMQEEIEVNIKNTDLPDEVKDQYADHIYDPSRPYNQTIHKILEEFSMTLLMSYTKASARALRNSDYASPELKTQLFDAILRCIEQISNCILLISPLLALHGEVYFEGASFVLEGNFGKDPESKFQKIVVLIPTNILNWFSHDLYSEKMAPLIFKTLESQNNDFKKHILASLVTEQRPRYWKSKLKTYISEKHRNSFYLMSTFKTLKSEYMYSYSDDKELYDIYELLTLTLEKHRKGVEAPSSGQLKNLIEKLQKQIPKRKSSKLQNEDE